MTYLVMQMLLCLILAFLLGLLVGWWLGRRKAEESARAMEAKDREVLDCRVDLKEARGQLKECQSGLEASQKELEKLRGQLQTSEGELDDVRGQLKTAEGELDDARGQLKTSEGELEDAKGHLEVCRGELEECRAAASDQDQIATPVALVDLDAGDDVESGDASEAAGTAEADDAGEADDDGEGAGDSGAGGAGAVVSTLMGGAAAADDAEPDDLKVVEGIGPKIESLLNAGGISTWAGLARAEISYLQSILDDAGPRYRIHDPGTWPQQAALAAAGSWEELEELQDRLKGGRAT